MKKVIKIGIVASSFLAANMATLTSVTASSINPVPKVTHVAKVQNDQGKNPLLRTPAYIGGPDTGGGRGCGMDWDTGNRGGKWWAKG